MKLVVHKGFGGFMLPLELEEEWGIDWDHEIKRNDPRLVDAVKKGLRILDCDLVVVEIPDEATDYIVEDYDGAEYVIYVLNGKLYREEP